MKVEFFGFLGAYLAALLLVTLLFSRKIRNLEDFFLASRNLPASLLYFSLVASWFGATSIIVSMDEAFQSGISSFWLIGAPAMLTVTLVGIFLVRLIHKLPSLTLSELVKLRYGPTVHLLTSLLIVWYMIVLAASQMVAMANFLKSLLGRPYLTGLFVGIVIVLFYSTLGGIFSIVINNRLQFFLLLLGMLSLFFFLFQKSSLSDVIALASSQGKSSYFDLFFNWERNSLIVLSFTLAWLISPIVWQRVQAARSAHQAKKALFGAAATFFLLYGLVVFIGIFSLPLFPSAEKTGPLVSELICSHLGTAWGGVVFVAVLAAVMSTMDTAINAGAFTLTRDIIQRIFPSSRQERNLLFSRISTISIGILSFFVATRFQNILQTIGLASEIMAEGLFVPGLAMIFLKKKLPWAGFLSLFLGGGFSLLSFLSASRLFPLNLPSWPFSLPFGFALSVAGFFCGWVIEKWKER